MIRFTRRDQNDNATETLTLVRLDSDGSLAIQIEAGTPDDLGDFVGLYDLDGDQLQLGNETWEIAEDESFDVRDAMALWAAAGYEDHGAILAANAQKILMDAWESGTSVCEAA